MLAAMSKHMARALAESPEFRYVANGESAFGAAELAVIERYRYQLSDRVDAAHFEAAQLRAALEERLEGLSGGAAHWRSAGLPTIRQARRCTSSRGLRRRCSPSASMASGSRATATPPCSLPRRSRLAGLRGPKARDCRRRPRLAAARHDDGARLRYSSPGAMSVASRTLIATDATGCRSRRSC
jgi:hypothetical protein